MGTSIPLWRAFFAALGLEVLLGLAILYAAQSQAREVVQPPQVTQIMLTQTPESPAPPAVTPPPPVPQVPVHRNQPVAVPLVQPQPVADSEPAPQTVAPSLPKEQAVSKDVPNTAPNPTVAIPQAAISVAFGDRVRAAVQAAVIYPMAARASHVTGRSKVSFSYRDGVVANLLMITSSGNVLLDKAAFAAVRAAAYPPPTEEYVGRLLNFEIWVRFFEGNEQD